MGHSFNIVVTFRLFKVIIWIAKFALVVKY